MFNRMKHLKTFEGYFSTGNDFRDKINVDAECDTCKDGKVRCVNCSSEGRDREACDTCKGTGWVDCPDCNGLSDCECEEDEEEADSKTNENWGATKRAEYRRTIELFEKVYKEKGLYYAIALLYDSQYDNEDLKNMMDEMMEYTKTWDKAMYGLKKPQ